MREVITSRNEHGNNVLLETFQKLTGLIKNRGDAELTNVMEELKLGIFTQLQARGIVVEGLTYEVWAEQLFPSSTKYNPTPEIQIVEVAEANGLITEQVTSDLLKAKLSKLITQATVSVNYAQERPRIAEAREYLNEDVLLTLTTFQDISAKLLHSMFGPQFN